MTDPIPSPRAAPPMTIGPFTNVPAAGSPIRSDWPQQITQYVVDRNPGRVVYQVYAKLTGTIPCTGLTDVMTVANVVISPAVAVNVIASAVVSFGNAGITNGSADILALYSSTVVSVAPTPYQCVAGGWQAVPLFGGWAVPAGGVIGFKCRVTTNNASNATAMATILAITA